MKIDRTVEKFDSNFNCFRVDEIEIFGNAVSLINFNNNKKSVLQLEKDMSFKNAIPILETYFKNLGAAQGRKNTIAIGEAIPWSRALEGGESAYYLDKKYGSEGNFSKMIWESYKENLPIQYSIIKESIRKFRIINSGRE